MSCDNCLCQARDEEYVVVRLAYLQELHDRVRKLESILMGKPDEGECNG